MEKIWIIEGNASKHYTTYEEAEKAAKRKLSEAKYAEDWKIFQLVAAVISPLPTFEVVKVQ